MSSDEASSASPNDELREQVALIDQVCDQFEAAWRAGQSPEIDRYLADHPALPRSMLLRELLFLELSYRLREEGGLPRLEEYLARFRSDTLLVAQVFSELERMVSPAGSHVVPGESLKQSRFRVVRFHDEGGLGRVWIATDQELKRQVALKDLKDCFAEVPQLRTRFVAEAEITARLEHPGIVPVYGFGQYEDGRPYYAMRFIHGRSLAHAIKQLYARSERNHVIAEHRIEFAQLLRRFLDVCHAIEFAHSQGIVHRDLKPSNIMLGEFGETLVVDWGLAKQESVAPPLGDDTIAAQEQSPQSSRSDDATWTYRAGATQPGTAIGTPQYMSPEQADGRVQDVGKASDIYGLGATLYCLLTGKAPFTPTAQSDIPEEGTVGALLERVKKGDKPPPRHVNPGAPKALAAICEKAMAVEPVDRYPEVRRMREDIECWLANEPVLAYREPLLESLGRWGRRHRTGVQAAVVVLLVTSIISVLAAWRLNHAKNITEQARHEAELLASRNEALALAEHDARQSAETQLAQARRNAYAAQLAGVATLALGDDPAGGYDLLADQRLCPFELRDFAWRHLHRWCRQDFFRRWRAHGSEILCFGVDRNGELAVSVAANGTVRIWDLDENVLLCEYQANASLTTAAINDQRVLALGLDTGEVRVWDMGSVEAAAEQDISLPEPLPGASLKGDARVRGIVFSGDGGTVAAILDVDTSDQPQIAIWDVATRLLVSDWTAPLCVNRLAVSSGGDRVAMGGWIAQQEKPQVPAVVLWDREKQAPLWKFSSGESSDTPATEDFWSAGAVTAVGFSGDGARLLMGTSLGALTILDAETGSPLAPLTPIHNGTIRTLVAGWRQFATAGPASSIRGGVYRPDLPVTLWRLEGARRMYDLAGLVGDVATMQFSPGESFLAVATSGGGLAVFDMRPQWTRSVLQAAFADQGSGYTPVVHVCFGDQGRTLSAVVGHSLHEDRVERLDCIERWDLLQGTRDASQALEESTELFVARDGTFVASGTPRDAADSLTLDVKELVTRNDVGRLTLADVVEVAAVSLAARKAAVLVGHERFEIVDLVREQIVCAWKVAEPAGAEQATEEKLPLCRFSPCGERLAVVRGSVPECVELRDTRRGRPIATLDLSASEVSCLAFSPDGTQLAIASRVREVPGTRTATIRFLPPRLTLWDTVSNTAHVCPHGHGGDIYSMSFSPDGKTLATVAHDMTVRLWDTASGLELLELETVSQTDAMSVAFSPDGHTLAVASWNGWIELWHATPQPRLLRRDIELLVERLSDTADLTDAMIRRFAEDAAKGSSRAERTTDTSLDALAILEYLSWHMALDALAEGHDPSAKVRIRAGQIEQFAALIRAADSGSQKALAALVAAHYLRGRHESALVLLRESKATATDVTSSPTPEILALEALVHLQMGRVEEAERLREAFQGELTETMDHVTSYRAEQLRQLSEILQRRRQGAPDHLAE